MATRPPSAMRLRADIALDHFSLCRRTVAFAAWRGAYMDDVRMFRERATVYRKTVESRALRVALYEWSDAAYARAVFREMEISSQNRTKLASVLCG